MSILIALALAEAASTAAAPAATGSITVVVNNVRSNKGKVLVGICPERLWLADDCPYRGEAPARYGSTTVVVPNVPAGIYGAQSFHDENGNRDVDRGMFGIPKEGVGFSRDARIRMSPPKWNEAVFTHSGRAEIIRFSLRYFTGDKGPAPR